PIAGLSVPRVSGLIGPDAAHLLIGLRDDLEHRLLRPVGVLAADGIGDVEVPLEGIGVRELRHQTGTGAAGEDLTDDHVEGGEEFVAAGAEHRPVEGDIGGEEGFDVALPSARAHPGGQSHDLLGRLGGGVLCRQPGSLGFDGHAQFGQRAQLPGRGFGHPPADDERVEQRPFVHGEHDQPDPPDRAEHAQRFDHPHDFPHDRQGHVVPGPQLLGLDDRAGGQSAGNDVLTDPVAQALMEVAAVRRVLAPTRLGLIRHQRLSTTCAPGADPVARRASLTPRVACSSTARSRAWWASRARNPIVGPEPDSSGSRAPAARPASITSAISGRNDTAASVRSLLADSASVSGSPAASALSTWSGTSAGPGAGWSSSKRAETSRVGSWRAEVAITQWKVPRVSTGLSFSPRPRPMAVPPCRRKATSAPTATAQSWRTSSATPPTRWAAPTSAAAASADPPPIPPATGTCLSMTMSISRSTSTSRSTSSAAMRTSTARRARFVASAGTAESP